MSEVAFETGKKIIAASHEWAANLDAGYSSVERERMRVGYANGALAMAAERDRLRASNAELLAALRHALRRAQDGIAADAAVLVAAIAKAEKG